jgi:O-antigen ligase
MTRANFAWFMRTYGLPFLMFFLLKGSAVSRGTLKRFMAIMIALGIYMAAVSVMEQSDLRDYIIPEWVVNPEINVDEGVRSGGLIMQAEFNGLALNLIYCILLGSIHWYRKGHPLLQSVGGALILLAVFFTYTRAAWIGTLVASLLLLLGGQASPWKRAGVLLTGLAILALLFLFPSKMGSERAEDANSVYFRFKVWTAGLRMAAVNPIFGQGFGSFIKNVSSYQTEAVYYRELPETGTLAHNTILNILVEQGALGLTLYLLILGGMVVKAKQGMASIWPRGSLLWVTTFASAYMFNVQFVNAHFPTPNFIFYGVLGVLSGLKERETGEMGGNSDQGNTRP